MYFWADVVFESVSVFCSTVDMSAVIIMTNINRLHLSAAPHMDLTEAYISESYISGDMSSPRGITIDWQCSDKRNTRVS